MTGSAASLISDAEAFGIILEVRGDKLRCGSSAPKSRRAIGLAGTGGVFLGGKTVTKAWALIPPSTDCSEDPGADPVSVAIALGPSRPTADRFDFLAAFHESALGDLDLAPIIARRLRDQKAMLVEPKCHMMPFGHGKGRLKSAGDRQRQAGRRISRSDWRSSSASRAHASCFARHTSRTQAGRHQGA
jgi:hypothetical protein